MFISMLTNLGDFLKKAERYAEKRKIDKVIFVNARLSPDMYALDRQIQIATDMVKKGAGRLSEKDWPTYEDNEKTFSELQVRIKKTISFLKTIKAKDLDGAENKKIQFAIREHKFKFKGDAYLTEWIIPNFFFHITTAYNILRNQGVNLGKSDFLGS